MIYDLIIVGGGIGGASLAAVMAQAGRSVLLLELSTVYEDRVRGEWIAPWGVAETRRLGLYDTLVAAGGHHLTSHVTYDETRDPAEAEATPLPLGIFAEGVPGPLCIRHPVHCQTLFDAAAAAGAQALRGVTVQSVELGASPSVTYLHEGAEHTARAALVVGADGRQSSVRRAAGIALTQDKPHHWFAGLLVGDAAGWNDPILGLGLSITYRDTRLVSDILKHTTPGAQPDFRPYAEERAERMRRLKAAADLQAGLDMEFGDAARERRRRYHEAAAADPTLGMHGFAVMAGPEAVPAEVFGAEHRARVLGAGA
ncbi:hypothetical protein GCM10011529_12280 [Polymorphobacter glacialis]|uniref:FAD-binding domain-containing protein n=1 Tax=Sandarakinorhabdus glacialis TaxID=1614636 RepID=A0A916ZQ14_9SPHN|nr:FAD-dependent monooxygenase [Polymorphobacter glacialis]GGE07405.1 hypothetical protein GCM10011529_12280 [Polymorphobacter glacialis]